MTLALFNWSRTPDGAQLATWGRYSAILAHHRSGAWTVDLYHGSRRGRREELDHGLTLPEARTTAEQFLLDEQGPEVRELVRRARVAEGRGAGTVSLRAVGGKKRHAKERKMSDLGKLIVWSESHEWGSIVYIEKGHSWRAVIHPEHLGGLLGLDDVHRIATHEWTDEQGYRWRIVRSAVLGRIRTTLFRLEHGHGQEMANIPWDRLLKHLKRAAQNPGYNPPRASGGKRRSGAKSKKSPPPGWKLQDGTLYGGQAVIWVVDPSGRTFGALSSRQAAVNHAWRLERKRRYIGGKQRHSSPSRLGALVSDINRLVR